MSKYLPFPNLFISIEDMLDPILFQQNVVQPCKVKLSKIGYIIIYAYNGFHLINTLILVLPVAFLDVRLKHTKKALHSFRF